jgi:hypothetical protein
MRKFKFNLTQLLLAVTWLCILATLASRYFATMPYVGDTHDIGGFTYQHYAFEESYETEISDDAIANAPSWPSSEANPPVSARRALAIADNYRRKRLVNRNNWKWGLDSISLLPIDGGNNKWCWQILFLAYPEKGGLGGVPPEFSVYVLMNGDIIEPTSKMNNLLRDWESIEKETESMERK